MRATAFFAALCAAAPASAQAWEVPDAPRRLTLTPAQLLAAAEQLVVQHRYLEARPLLTALAMAPGYRSESRYLSGVLYSATGDLSDAAAEFETVLADEPRQTKARVALANILLAQKKTASADRQLRIAEQDRDIPPEVARTIRSMRDTIRAGRAWRLELNAGIAPDTNINGATGGQTVTVLLGGQPIPLDLDRNGRARSGLGATARISAGLRLPVSPRVSLLAELDGLGTKYRNAAFDDYLVQLAAGGEYRLSKATSLSLEGVGAERWFGGRAVTRQAGVRGGVQATIDPRNRLGIQLDLRRTTAFFDSGYSGWQGGLYTTYERAIAKTIVVSFCPFVRHDWLAQRAYANTEIGGTIGVGGELPHGLTFGASVSLSRARFEEPLRLFADAPRHDERAVFRATLGDRKLRVLGLSPQIGWTWTRNASSYRLYDTRRSRFEFTLARYF